MTGSEKQIKWAEDIMKAAAETCQHIIKMAETYEANATGNEDSVQVLETVNGQTAMVKYPRITVAVARQLAEMVEQGFAGIDSASQVISLRDRFTFNSLTKMAVEASH